MAERPSGDTRAKRGWFRRSPASGPAPGEGETSGDSFDDPWSADAWSEEGWDDQWQDRSRRARVRPAADPRSADVDAWLESDQSQFADVTADMARKWKADVPRDQPGVTWDDEPGNDAFDTVAGTSVQERLDAYVENERIPNESPTDLDVDIESRFDRVGPITASSIVESSVTESESSRDVSDLDATTQLIEPLGSEREDNGLRELADVDDAATPEFATQVSDALRSDDSADVSSVDALLAFDSEAISASREPLADPQSWVERQTDAVVHDDEPQPSVGFIATAGAEGVSWSELPADGQIRGSDASSVASPNLDVAFEPEVDDEFDDAFGNDFGNEFEGSGSAPFPDESTGSAVRFEEEDRIDALLRAASDETEAEAILEDEPVAETDVETEFELEFEARVLADEAPVVASHASSDLSATGTSALELESFVPPPGSTWEDDAADADGGAAAVDTAVPVDDVGAVLELSDCDDTAAAVLPAISLDAAGVYETLELSAESTLPTRPASFEPPSDESDGRTDDSSTTETVDADPTVLGVGPDGDAFGTSSTVQRGADLVDGDVLDGDVLDGDLLDGDVLDGDLLDGDVLDGDVLDGDLLDADLRDAESLDAEPAERDDTDGRVSAMDGSETGDVEADVDRLIAASVLDRFDVDDRRYSADVDRSIEEELFAEFGTDDESIRRPSAVTLAVSSISAVPRTLRPDVATPAPRPTPLVAASIDRASSPPLNFEPPVKTVATPTPPSKPGSPDQQPAAERRPTSASGLTTAPPITNLFLWIGVALAAASVLRLVLVTSGTLADRGAQSLVAALGTAAIRLGAAQGLLCLTAVMSAVLAAALGRGRSPRDEQRAGWISGTAMASGAIGAVLALLGIRLLVFGTTPDDSLTATGDVLGLLITAPIAVWAGWRASD